MPEATILAALDVSGLPYEVLPCDPKFANTAAFCEHYGYSLDNSANMIVVKAKGSEQKFAACVLLATTKLDTNRVVRKRLGARRVSFASAEETRELTGMEIGGVAPIALPDALPLWVDHRVMDCNFVLIGGGDRYSKIKISPDYFHKTPSTAIVEGLAKEKSQ